MVSFPAVFGAAAKDWSSPSRLWRRFLGEGVGAIGFANLEGRGRGPTTVVIGVTNESYSWAVA